MTNIPLDTLLYFICHVNTLSTQLLKWQNVVTNPIYLNGVATIRGSSRWGEVNLEFFCIELDFDEHCHYRPIAKRLTFEGELESQKQRKLLQLIGSVLHHTLIG